MRKWSTKARSLFALCDLLDKLAPQLESGLMIGLHMTLKPRAEVELRFMEETKPS